MGRWRVPDGLWSFLPHLLKIRSFPSSYNYSSENATRWKFSPFIFFLYLRGFTFYHLRFFLLILKLLWRLFKQVKFNNLPKSLICKKNTHLTPIRDQIEYKRLSLWLLEPGTHFPSLTFSQNSINTSTSDQPLNLLFTLFFIRFTLRRCNTYKSGSTFTSWESFSSRNKKYSEKSVTIFFLIIYFLKFFN